MFSNFFQSSTSVVYVEYCLTLLQPNSNSIRKPLFPSQHEKRKAKIYTTLIGNISTLHSMMAPYIVDNIVSCLEPGERKETTTRRGRKRTETA